MDVSALLHEDTRSRRAAEGVDPARFMKLGRSVLASLTAGDEGSRPAAWGWLDLVRRGAMPSRIGEHGGAAEWWPLILQLIDASQFTVGRLLAQRVESYGPRTLFVVLSGTRVTQRSWSDAAARIDRLARGLWALVREQGDRPVAFLSENRLDMALCDLACLTSGIVDVMIPPNLGDDEVADILARAGAGTLIVSGPELARRVERLRGSGPFLHTVIDLDNPDPAGPGLMGVPELLARGADIPADDLARARDAVRLDDLATVMFTSGTTGRPKGIRFSVRNLVTKRFARGLALPSIGERDVFLCYLPLCHTFGRYLEMLGCIHWGATYTLMGDPSFESLLDGLAQVRPTVFISVPQRWIQLHDEVARRVDLERAHPDLIGAAVREVVGGRLRWGLSAAGYLSPEIFRFFQRNGVELLSGFGMTEATGGITMTPPGGYRDESLGTPLPGIELRLEADSELSVRGPYVMQGYSGEAESGLDEEGWFRTGDLFERDTAGHFRLVDRKKEIYKNTKGQTVAPQRVENLFRDFPAIKRVFLVGDHREYNTLLIVPDPGFAAANPAAPSSEEQRDVFRTMVASVNRFLAPYERVVDFALLSRDFNEEEGELTRKGTFRRPNIAANFAPVIAAMYHRTRLAIAEEGPGLIFPNWLFQALALTTVDVRLESGRLVALPAGASLTVACEGRVAGAWRVRIGSCRYAVESDALDLGLLVICPELWLGNDELTQFAPLGASTRTRRQRRPADITPLGRAIPYAPALGDAPKLEAATVGKVTINVIDRAARALGSEDEHLSLLGIEVLRRVLGSPPQDEIAPELARLALRGAANAPSQLTRREAFRRLWPLERDEAAAATMDRFFSAGGELLDDPTAAAIAAEDFSESKFETVLEAVRRATIDVSAPGAPHLTALIALLARHGVDHPGRYRRLRWVLGFVEAHAGRPEDRRAATAARRELTAALHRWLGEPQAIAVDPDSRREYRWDDVVVFAPTVDPQDQAQLEAAIRGTSLLRESIFLFSGGVTVRLGDIPPGGVRIAPCRSHDGRSTYRATVETRYYGTFDVAFVLNRRLPPEEVDEELLWLILAGEPRGGDRLAPELGGYWPEHNLWTEEFIVGETASQLVERLAAGDEPADARLGALGPFVLWTAAEAFIDFWDRTGRRLVIAHPSPARVVVPTHDYQIGPRLTSISEREPYRGPAALLASLEIELVGPLAALRPTLGRESPLRLLTSALLEVVGAEAGLQMLEDAAREDPERAATLRRLAEEVRTHGFADRRLYFAIERYRRWAALAPDATREAQAFTIRQLRETYNLFRSYERRPEARARYFRETVLRGATGALGDGLDELIGGLARGEVTPDQLRERLDALRLHAAPGSAEEYFLVRLSWPHVRPGDDAQVVSLERGGVRQSEVVITREDGRGRPFLIRRPLSPREVGDLHRLFMAARLPVSFRADHQFLVALDLAGRLIGGLFYEIDPAKREAYLEKIVVAEALRRQGLSHALMQEFMRRLQAEGVRFVTTGYFRPDYFVHFGFRVDRAYGGQVRLLDESPSPD